MNKTRFDPCQTAKRPGEYPTCSFRLFSPLGLYPQSGIQLGAAHITIDEDIAYSVIPIERDDRSAQLSEMEFLRLEEIRFYAAVMLSLPPDQGLIYLYPLASARVAALNSCDSTLSAQANIWREQVASEDLQSSVFLNVEYAKHETYTDQNVLAAYIENVSLDDYLVLRGLHAFIKATMLFQHRQFADAATMFLHVAMDATFRIIQRRLRAEGNSNPSSLDACAFIENAFHLSPPSGRHYFEDFYSDRIRSSHAESRFGVTPYPPLAADDFYDLRWHLSSVFTYLLANHIWD